MKLMPSLIPFVKLSGNRAKFEMLWKALFEAHFAGDNLEPIAKRFMSLHPELKEDVIHLARHFTHLMCIHYEFESDAYLNYERQVFNPIPYHEYVKNELKYMNL